MICHWWFCRDTANGLLTGVARLGPAGLGGGAARADPAQAALRRSPLHLSGWRKTALTVRGWGFVEPVNGEGDWHIEPQPERPGFL